MGLLATCLLPLLAPQAPTPPATTALSPVPTAVATTQDPVDTTALRVAEADDAKADPAALVRCANGTDATLAGRAAWLLARGNQPARQPFLQQIVAGSPHAEARLQALQALLRVPEVGSTTTALHALEDGDRRVRTLAAQLLGALARPTAREPLLALLQAQQHAEPGPATDVQAALLALHDLDAHDLLLRAATAVHDGNAQGVGEALAFCLQQLSPKLDHDRQVMLALGLLDHREALARRFAITRLAELGEKSAVQALEGRLASEGPELRPLLEVALAHLRQDSVAPDQLTPTDVLHALDHKVKAWWQQSTPLEQGAVASAPAIVFIVLMLTLRRRRQVHQHADAEAAAALVQPSSEFAEHGPDVTHSPAAAAAWSTRRLATRPVPRAATPEVAEGDAANAAEPTAEEGEFETVADGQPNGWQGDAGSRH